MIDKLDKVLRRASSKYAQRELRQKFAPQQGVPNPKRSGARVLFIPFYTDPLFFARETFMAKALEWRGCYTSLLYADHPIAPTERGYLENKLGLSHPVFSGGKQLLEHLHQEGLPLSRYYRPLNDEAGARKLDAYTASPEAIAGYEYRGIPIGDLVIASSIRIQLSMGPEWGDATYRKLVGDLMQTGIALVDTFFRAYEDFAPDRVVMSHGIYLSWGIAFRVARQLELPVLVYNGSYRRDTLRMYLNVPNAPFPEAEWPTYSSQPLTAEEQKWTENYLASRSELKDEGHDVFGQDSFPEALTTFIRRAKEEGKPLAALFTNMSWDAYAFSGDGAFASMVDWANQTLEFARQHPDLRLIFKVHPAESYWNIPEAYRIRNHLSEIPPNVLLLSETDKVKPFTFYKHLDFGLINISTVAVEMAFLGIPVLTSGAGGHYEKRGFTISPADKTEYFDHLSRLAGGTSDFVPDRETLLRYVYYRFYREAIPFEPLEMDAYSIKAVTINSYEDLQPGKLPGVDALAEGILHARPVVWEQPPPN